jgi:N-acetyl-gamma-glutamyl-phosphate reductase
MISVGILGSAGYTGGELIRILSDHPEAELSFVHSNSMANLRISEVHRDLFYLDRTFDSEMHSDVDVIFFCMGHGQSVDFLKSNPIPESVKLIDLSQDHRIDHPDHRFVYGLPEYQRSEIRKASHIANPGCFATAIQLALLPLAKNQWLNEDVHIHGITGSTGAGQSLSETSHFSWRNNNVSVYKAFRHQHLLEVNQTMGKCQANWEHQIHFVPVRGNFTRGILISAYLKLNESERTVQNIYRSYYEDHPFVRITDENPDIKQVVNTNFCLLNIQKHGDHIHIISVIDNLLKGASGQAVQNMNLIFDLDEGCGLRLKSTAF